MIGAIIGDIVGSKYEFNNYLSKDFEFFDRRRCSFTDDTVMTCAVAYTLMEAEQSALKKGEQRWAELTDSFIVEHIREIGRRYPNCGYGRKFYDWMNFAENPQPYNSCGNGSAMRISPVGRAARSEEEVKFLSGKMTAITHNHPEGLKGAECTAMLIFKACRKATKEELSDLAHSYYPEIKTCDEYRTEQMGMHGREICQVSVPQALACFLESTDFEDCIRNCVSIGGDSDTIGAIAGGIAEAYYGVSEKMKNEALQFLSPALREITEEFLETYERFES